jgi:E3 ubiquitin-protein ligase ZNF598
MSTASETAAQAQSVQTVSGNGGRKPRGHRMKDSGNAVPGLEQAVTDKATNGDRVGRSEDGAVCWICAEPVKFYSLSGCNHRTCHVCALRLRALYKRMDCTFCKVSISHLTLLVMDS